MENERNLWGGVALLVGVGLVAGIVLPGLANKSRLAVRRATGVTHRSGVSNPGVRTTVDPARGIAA